MLSHLDVPIQQLTGQALERVAIPGEARQLPEKAVGAGVPDHVTWRGHAQGPEVIVDGVTHHHFTLQYPQHLQQMEIRTLKHHGYNISIHKIHLKCIF